MEFKVGDKVKILNRVGDETDYYPVYVNDMIQYAGIVTTIMGFTNSGSLVLDNNCYYWDKRAVELVNENKYLHPSELKNGDFIKIENRHCSYIYIFKEYKNNIIYRYVSLDLEDKNLDTNSDGKWGNFSNSDKITYATKEEKKLLACALAKEGYDWDTFGKILIEIPKSIWIPVRPNSVSLQELNLFPTKKHYQLNFNY